MKAKEKEEEEWWRLEEEIKQKESKLRLEQLAIEN